ncbi:MAG: acetolactate synthase small subunit [Bacteroidales bacterium]|jgi:acetolactate synthase-1/3 small subunit|nr:acetolactate synthase small subunit [Bacteroidales bacterium]MBR3287087.1 acetolactate synthase small subunit [Bacteroidales bacterium]MCR5715083.1 acetolactate synthase small subunit [Bacteroidales bacterium]
MNQEFTITAFSENSIGLLNRITIIFTRRRLNIESLTVSASAIRGIHKFTIVVNTTREQIEKVTLQIEKLVEVLKAYYHVNEELVYQEIALYKVPTQALLDSSEVEHIIRRFGARILEVTHDFAVIEKTGHQDETAELFKALDAFGVIQFTRSGRISIHREKTEALQEHLSHVDRISRRRHLT